MIFIVSYRDGSRARVDAVDRAALNSILKTGGKPYYAVRAAGLMDLCQRTPEPPSRTAADVIAAGENNGHMPEPHGCITGCSDPEEHRHLHEVKK